ncbi:hypothetical protein AHF37_12442 [Paragonimus kellicotti]|nr:hypothetical protein AHF37_12442 [Paragonimus kellicotti]
MSDEEGDLQSSLSPAVKVGGMRIARHVRESEEKPLPKSELVKQAAEHNSEITAVSANDLVTRVSTCKYFAYEFYIVCRFS